MPDAYDKGDCRDYRAELKNEIIEVKKEINIAHKRIDKMFYWMLAAIILIAFDITLKVHDMGKKHEVRYIKIEENKNVRSSD